MKLYQDILSIPISIGGKSVILTSDIVSEIDPVEVRKVSDLSTMVMPESRRHHAIWAWDNDISALHDEYKGVPVYGLVQTVINSGLVDEDIGLQLIKLTDNSGLYLIVQDGKVIEADLYSGNHLPIDESIGLSFHDALSIEFEVDELRLPKQEIESILDKSKKAEKVRRKQWVYRGIAVSLIATIAYGVDFFLENVFNEKISTYEAKKSDHDAIVERLHEAEARRLLNWPDNGVALARLMQLASVDPTILINDISLDEKTYSATVQNIDPDNIYKWATTKRNQDGSWTVNWKE